MGSPEAEFRGAPALTRRSGAGHLPQIRKILERYVVRGRSMMYEVDLRGTRWYERRGPHRHRHSKGVRRGRSAGRSVGRSVGISFDLGRRRGGHCSNGHDIGGRRRGTRTQLGSSTGCILLACRKDYSDTLTRASTSVLGGGEPFRVQSPRRRQRFRRRCACGRARWPRGDCYSQLAVDRRAESDEAPVFTPARDLCGAE